MAWSAHASLERPPRNLDLPGLVARIERFQRRRPDTDATRAYNHQMVDALHGLRPLGGRRLLDVGASYAGYSLERALHHGAAEFVGLSLEINRITQVAGPRGHGRLLPMDAQALDFDDGSFDLALSLSTFEHLHDGPRVLRELHRVLAPGGALFLSFEPVWTCSYGHHLHHLPQVARQVPPWGHLLWTPERMRAELAAGWPADAAKTLDQALHWIYQGTAINRVPGRALRAQLEDGPFEVEWIVPLPDDETLRPAADEAARLLPHDADELMTRGYSALLSKR